jgi:hypothetical protein
MDLGELFKKPDLMSPEEFWKQTAEKRGAEIKYYTFAIYLGRSKETLLDLGGLLYLAGDTLWFEDFEKQSSLFGFQTSGKLFGAKKPYVKTEFSVPRADIVSAKVISKKAAMSCVMGWMEPANAPVITRWGDLFSRPAVQIGLREGKALYFDAMKERELVGLLS